MVENNLSDKQQNSGLYKAAIIILSLDEDMASEILSMMTETEVYALSQVMATIGPVKAQKSNEIILEFKELLSQTSNLSGDIATTRKVLSKFLDEESIDTILSGINQDTENIWHSISMINEELFATYLKEEHPQIVSLILSKLKADYIANVISFFPEDLAVDIITRIVNMTSVKKGKMKSECLS